MYRQCKRNNDLTGRLALKWGVLICFVLLAGCAGTPVSETSGPPAMAVWTLEDLSLPGTTQAGLGELMTASVMETVETSGTYALVERERLLAVLQELSLGSGDLADKATGLRIGRIVGARLMLFGAYQVVAAQMRVDLRLVDVETGKVLNAAQKTVPAGNLSAWIQAASAATQDLLLQQ